MNDGETERKFEVRFEVEVHASSPEQAAAIARDMMLDPDTQVHGGVHAFEYCEPAKRERLPSAARRDWVRDPLLRESIIRLYAAHGVELVNLPKGHVKACPRKGG